jgi:hypothetical protein
MDLLEPLFGLARYARRDDRLPRALVLDFFRAKEASTVAARLEAFDRETLDPSLLHRLLAGEDVRGPSREPPSTHTYLATARTGGDFDPIDLDSSRAARTTPPEAPREAANSSDDASASAPRFRVEIVEADDAIKEMTDEAAPEPRRETDRRETDRRETDRQEATGERANERDNDDDSEQPLWKRYAPGDAPPPPPRRPAADRPTPAPAREDDEDDDEQPLWKRFQRPGPDRGPIGPPPEEARSHSGTTPSGSRHRDLDRRDSGRRDTDRPGASRPRADRPRDAYGHAAPPPASDDLRRLEREVLGEGGDARRALFVGNLFDGDRAAYRRVLARLADVESWSAASHIIARDVFRAYQVNIYSDAAVLFTNAVEAQYR